MGPAITAPMFSRLLLIGALALVAPLSACIGGGGDELRSDSPNPNPDPDLGGGGGMDGATSGCEIASDCVLAASTCCECPSFAVPAGQGYDAGCDEVDCEASGLCPAVEASCDQGQCVMICSPLITDKTCSFGFEADVAGCLINECAGGPTSFVPECEISSDCVQVAADCCGCGLGGLDKAIPAELADDDADLLNCPVDPACPGIDVCNADESAQCVAGLCTLVTAPGSPTPPDEAPANLCGTPELPVCATGFSCVLNAVSANDASALGVGTCVAD